MRVLQSYYNTVVRQDFITKFSFDNCLEIPALKKIVLCFNISQGTLNKLLPSLVGLFLISNQKPCFSVKKRFFLTLKVKSGSFVSCKVDLRNSEKFYFLERLIFFFIPRLKNFTFNLQKRNVFFKIDNVFLFREIEKDYEYFQDLPPLNVNIFLNTTNSQLILYLLAAFKFPIKKIND
jgi:ribosomal protein L5